MKVDVKVGVDGKDTVRGQRLFSTPPEEVLGGAKPLTIRFFDGATKPCWKTCEQVSTTEFKTWGDETDYLYEGRKVFLKFKTTTPWSETGNYEVDDFVLHEDKTYICMQDHESSSETEPGNSAGYWSIAIFSVTVVSSIYNVDDDETTCEVEESQVFPELYSFKKWADIPEWCGALTELGTHEFTANTYDFTRLTHQGHYTYLANDHLVDELVIANEYDEEGKTEEEIDAIWDRKPLCRVENRDEGQRWAMQDGRYNFRIGIVSSPTEDPDHETSPDLEEDGDTIGTCEIFEDDENGAMVVQARAKGNYGLRFNEVGTRSYCHYFESSGIQTSDAIKYSTDWFCPDGIFFAPFDTTDTLNFSVTTSPEYSVDGEGGEIIPNSGGDVEIYLMPRRWLYRASHRTSNIEREVTSTPYIVITDPPGGGDELPDDFDYIRRFQPPYVYPYITSDPVSYLGGTKWKYLVFTNTNNVYRYDAMWWDRPPNQLCLQELDDDEETISMTAFPIIRRCEYYAGGNGRGAEYTAGAHFAGDVAVYTGNIIKVSKVNNPNEPSEYETVYLRNQIDKTIVGDEDKDGAVEKMEDAGATEEEIDAVISGYNSVHLCSVGKGDVYVDRPIGSLNNTYPVRGVFNIGSKANGKVIKTNSSVLGTSDDDFRYLWSKIEDSEFWSDYGILSDVNENGDWEYTRWSGIPYSVSISPHKSGSLLAIVKTKESVYYIWRKTDEGFNLYSYSPDSYNGHDVLIEPGLVKEVSYLSRIGSLWWFDGYSVYNATNVDYLWSQIDVEDNRKIVAFGKPPVSLGLKTQLVGSPPVTVYRTWLEPDEDAEYELEMPGYAAFSRMRAIPQYFEIDIVGSNKFKVKPITHRVANSGYTMSEWRNFAPGGNAPTFSGEVILVNDSYDEWQEDVEYSEGEIVKYRKKDYECLVNHMSSASNNPLINQEYWKLKIIRLEITNATFEETKVDIIDGEYNLGYWSTAWTEVTVDGEIPAGTIGVLHEQGSDEVTSGVVTRISGLYGANTHTVEERNAYD
jgi:hypothetical protein